MAESSSTNGEPLKEVIVRGFKFPPMVTEKSLNEMENYDVRDDDVWITTYPKAGTNIYNWQFGRTNVTIKLVHGRNHLLSSKQNDKMNTLN